MAEGVATYPRFDFSSDSSLAKAFFSTLTAGMTVTPDGYNMLQPGADFSAYWLKLYEDSISSESMTDFDQEMLTWLRKEAKNGDWERFRKAAAEVCHMRKFFCTSKGFFGLGPAMVQADGLVNFLGRIPLLFCGGQGRGIRSLMSAMSTGLCKARRGGRGGEGS